MSDFRNALRGLPALAVLGLAASAAAAPVHYELPAETAALAPGPGQDGAQVCTACHSADYISTQPRGLPDPHAFWSAEVTKMQKSYGAPIDNEDAAKIVTYLAEAYR